MRRGARGLALIAAMLFLLVGGVAAAQDKPAEKPASTPAEKAADKPADNVDVLRDKLRADKRLVVAESSRVDREGSAGVLAGLQRLPERHDCPLRPHLQAAGHLRRRVQVDDRPDRDPAARRVHAVQTNYLNIITSYVPKFQRVLPPRKVARLYQVENKIRALVDYQFAQEVPLIK